MRPVVRLLVILGAGLGCTVASAQNLPTKLTECEGGQCVPGGGGAGVWTFNGRQGHAEWPGSGAIANLMIERFDVDGVVIRRSDVVGRTPGLTAIYTGKLQGNRIEGDVTWSWPGHWSRSPMGKWSATIVEREDTSLPAITTTASTALNPDRSHPPSPDNPASATFDLNGVWEGTYGIAGSSDDNKEKILIYHFRNCIQAINIEGRRFVRPGDRFLVALYPLPASLPVRIAADIHALQSPDSEKLVWLGTTVSIDDADHLRIAGTEKFHRVSKRQVNDVRCEDANSHHIGGEDAYLRGNACFELKDLATANCWFHIGAMQGYARAQSSYAYSLLNGRGIAQNTPEAMMWAQKAADQHDAYGEATLANIYLQQGFALGTAQAAELAKRYKQHDPDMAYIGSSKPSPMPTMPIFVRDKALTYDLNGEWKLIFPENSRDHPLVEIVVVLKDRNLQMIVGNPNALYPIGESIFNGRYADNHLTGDLMDAPAHGGNGYAAYVWAKAEIQIVDADNLILPHNIKMKRTSGELGANKACDAVKYAGIDASRAFNYADKDYELRNYGNAACWLYVSASQGNSEAQLDLGLLLHFGTGVKKDLEQSFLWFEKAADQGNLDAERALAHCYQFGVGVQKNPTLARSWTTRVDREVQQAREAEIEEQRAKRNLALWGAILTDFKSPHELRVEGYEGRGMSRDRAEDAARSDEAEEEFFNNLMHGYQPPPMPRRP